VPKASDAAVARLKPGGIELVTIGFLADAVGIHEQTFRNWINRHPGVEYDAIAYSENGPYALFFTKEGGAELLKRHASSLAQEASVNPTTGERTAAARRIRELLRISTVLEAIEAEAKTTGRNFRMKGEVAVLRKRMETLMAEMPAVAKAKAAATKS
jgi:hypothetical protein